MSDQEQTPAVETLPLTQPEEVVVAEQAEVVVVQETPNETTETPAETQTQVEEEKLAEETPKDESVEVVAPAVVEETPVPPVVDEPTPPAVEEQPPVVEPTPEVVQEPTPEPVVVTPVAAPEAPVSVTEEIVAESLLAEAIGKVALRSKLALTQVADYIKAMAPAKPISDADGGRHQTTLYRAITNIINNSCDDFTVAFSALLGLFVEHRNGVFHETHVFRFSKNTNLSEAESRAFLRLLNFIKLTADPKARQLALKQVRIDQTLSYGITDEGRQKVLEFFHL